jgi:hypothetical protein
MATKKLCGEPPYDTTEEELRALFADFGQWRRFV